MRKVDSKFGYSSPKLLAQIEYCIDISIAPPPMISYTSPRYRGQNSLWYCRLLNLSWVRSRLNINFYEPATTSNLLWVSFYFVKISHKLMLQDKLLGTNIKMTSYQRRCDVIASTLIRRHFNVMCPLGNNDSKTIPKKKQKQKSKHLQGTLISY